MKTKKIYLFALSAAFVFFGTFAPVRASEILEVNAIDESKMIRIELTTPATANINVMLFDDSERILYNDQISSGTTFEDEFDFSNFKAGSYKLVSELGNMRVNRIIEVNDEGVLFTERYYSFTPQFKIEDDKLQVHLINSQQNDITISVENDFGMVFDSYYNNTGEIFSEVFGLQALQNGSYTMYVMTGGEMFSHDFNIE